MFARLLKKRILHHRHPSDCLHYLARCVFFVIIPHRCANNWCTLGVSWPFQAFDFSFFLCFHEFFVCGQGIAQCATDSARVSLVFARKMWLYLPPLRKHRKRKNTRNSNTFVVAQRGRQTRVKRLTGVRKGIASCYRGKHHETRVSVHEISLSCYHGKIQLFRHRFFQTNENGYIQNKLWRH